MMWDRLGSKGKILLIVALIAGAVFCFYRFVLTSQLEAYARVKDDLAREEAELARAQATVASLKDEQAKLEKARRQLAEVGQFFSSEMRYGGSVLVLGMKAAARNVEVTALEPGTVKEGTYLLELPFKLTVEGDYPAVLEFWRDLENLSSLVELRYAKLERMAPSEGAVPSGRVKGNLTLVMYSSKTPEGERQLEEAARWLTGRYNLFRPAGSIPPVPELAGRLKLPAAEGGTQAGSTSPGGQTVGSAVYGEGQKGEPGYVWPK